MPRHREFIKWSGEDVQRETGLNARTFASRATKAGIEPAYAGDNGVKRFYSTKQVMDILHGDLEAERIRETKENADRLAIANAKTRGELVTTDSVFSILENMFVAIRQVIKQSGLSEVEKHECLKQLREIKVDDLISEKQEEAA